MTSTRSMTFLLPNSNKRTRNLQKTYVPPNTLQLFSEEMLNNNVHANTLLAMGVLIQNLDALRGEARKDFTAKFATFKHEENQSEFKALLAAKD